MAIMIFHGGCHGCMRQEESGGFSLCPGCMYFRPDWSLPNLNREAAAERERLKARRRASEEERKERERCDDAIKRAIARREIKTVEDLAEFKSKKGWS